MFLSDKDFHNRYRVIKQLEKGKMSTLFQAVDKRFDNTVVLKEVLTEPDCLTDSNQHKLLKIAFDHEVKILAEGYHGIFPHLIDCFVENNRHYLVMELFEGDNLAGMLRHRENPFPLEEIMKWSDQMLDTLDYLHSYALPFFFGDFRPQNLKPNSRGKIKMLDCGVFKSAEEHMATTKRTETFEIPDLTYLPIERITPALEELSEAVTEESNWKTNKQLSTITPARRSDIYSLSATLYQITTGLAPTDALQRNVQVLANGIDPLPYPHVLNPNIPEEISAVILRGMQIECENRYGSAAEMKNSLNSALANINNRERSIKKAVCCGDLSFEQAQLDHGVVENKTSLSDEAYNIEIMQNDPSQTGKNKKPVLEVQQLSDEQERLRVAAERLWFDQENRFAEQSRLQIEAESAEIPQQVADLRQLIAKNRSFEPEKKLSEKEDCRETENSSTIQLSDDLTDQTDHKPVFKGIIPEPSNQNVASETLSKERL